MCAHAKTEDLLLHQGRSLIDVADTTTAHIDLLHDKIDRTKYALLSTTSARPWSSAQITAASARLRVVLFIVFTPPEVVQDITSCH